MENRTENIRIAIQHEALGVEGDRAFAGTLEEAKQAARAMAKRGGHGWVGIVQHGGESYPPVREEA